MKFMAKNQKLLHQMYCWNLDYDLRIAMGGETAPQSLDIFCNGFDTKYDGGANILLGVLDDTERIVGSYCLENMDFQNLRCYLHTTFPEENKQFVKDSFSKLCDFVFKERHMRQLLTHVSAFNKRALHAAPKFGFEEIAILPDYYNTPDGWKGCHVFRLTPDKRVV